MEEEILIENIAEIIIVGTFSLFTFFGGALLFIILYQKKVIRSQKEKQQLETDYQKELLHSHIETQEKERQRIAADLHDGIGASLAAVRLMINRVKPLSDADKDLLAECKSAIQKTADSAREISHDLLPPSLEALGLVKILKRMCKNVSSESLQLTFQSSMKEPLDKKVELALFRIVQEMMNNTIKHAKASLITMELNPIDNGYMFHYFDNGKGFSTENSQGLGFRNIETRLQMIGASHEFFSEPMKQSGIKIFITNEH